VYCGSSYGKLPAYTEAAKALGKAMMAKYSDGFIALPGGLGTMEELFEVWTWAQLGFHQKPCGLMNVANYYDHLTAFITHAVDQEALLVAVEPNDLIEQMVNYQAVPGGKWIGRDDL